MLDKIYSTPLTFRVLDPQKTFSDQSESTKIDFAENQQFSSLISLSPLNAIPHDFLQQIRVRSLNFYVLLLITFSSLDFGFNYFNFGFFSPIYFLFAYHYLFKLATIIKLLTHYTKGTIFCSFVLPNSMLCDCYFLYFKSFHPFIGFCFIFPSQYLCTID